MTNPAAAGQTDQFKGNNGPTSRWSVSGIAVYRPDSATSHQRDYTSGGICHTRGEVIPGVNPVKGAKSSGVSGKSLRLDWAQLH